MKTYSAVMVDQTHFELAEPVALKPGDIIEIAILDFEEEGAWIGASGAHLLQAYDDSDSAYDAL